MDSFSFYRELNRVCYANINISNRKEIIMSIKEKAVKVKEYVKNNKREIAVSVY